MWWIKAAIHEYILRSWSLVKIGTTANQKKLFFNLRKAKSKIAALEEGDMHPDQVKLIAQRLGVNEQDVVEMNRRLGGDVSLNAQMRDDPDSGEWQDWLVDEGSADQESRVVESEESENRKKALAQALSVLNARERRIFEARRLAEDPSTLEDLASEFGVSRERVRQIEVRAFQKVQRAAQIAIAHRQPSLALHWGILFCGLLAQRTRCAPLPLVGRGWGGGPSTDHCTTPTPAQRSQACAGCASLPACACPPHKGEGRTESPARADPSSTHARTVQPR
jgi:RNA polymerase sigma factor (sigma-70 family)